MSDEPGRSVGIKRARNSIDCCYDEEAKLPSKKGIVKTFWACNQSEGVELNFKWY